MTDYKDGMCEMCMCMCMSLPLKLENYFRIKCMTSLLVLGNVCDSIRASHINMIGASHIIQAMQYCALRPTHYDA